jgi:uncharacterized protein (TIGR02996 family)
MSHSAFSDDDKAFLRAILSNPAELTAWLVYADWLDEHDDPRAAFIRLELKRLAHDTTQTERFGIVAQLEELRPALDPDWVVIFDRPRVENCDALFAFKCPKQWEKLKGTDDPTVRLCDACQKEVYYCHTIREAFEHARQGDCVAIAEGVPRSPGDLEHDPSETVEYVTMGIPMDLTAPITSEPRTDWHEVPPWLRDETDTVPVLPALPEPPPPPPPAPRRPWWKFW